MAGSVALPTIDLSLAAAVCIVFGAAIVRGFSGFGFSLLTITALSLIYPLQQVLAPIFMMELAASINLLPAIWRGIHWKSLAPLIGGTIIGTPIGVWFLSRIPAAPMQLALSVFVLVATALLWTGYSLKRMPNLPSTVAAGAAAGMANGAFGIGGPPVILFYFASPADAAAGRASLTAFFFAIDVIGLATLSAMADLVTFESVVRAIIYLPALIAGVWIGHHWFKGVDEGWFRKAVLLLLAFMAFLIAFKAIGAVD
jgi:uncharacterized membrane protein YfcA